MSTLRTIYDRLRKPDRDSLMYAFENNLPQYVVYGDHNFIGVNLNGDTGNSFPELNIEAKHGRWCLGKVKNDNVKERD